MESRLTRWDELRLWWAFKGELTMDLITYYALCAVVGYVEGWYIGRQIVASL
jgi:hypothetical protein